MGLLLIHVTITVIVFIAFIAVFHLSLRRAALLALYGGWALPASFAFIEFYTLILDKMKWWWRNITSEHYGDLDYNNYF